MIDFILRPIRRRFGKDRMFYAAIDDMFGFIPHNIELYKLALIHKSASVTLDDGRQINNERLEFLGDAVIESVTSDYLFIEFPDQNEGFLTQLRSKMVSRQSLNEVAKRLKLDTHVITHSSASFSQKHIYGDAFEAMMGAIYLDQGYDFVNRLLINRIFGDYLRTGALLEEETDFKSRLIEWCQKNHHSIRFITSHDKNYSSAHPIFYCKVLIDDIEAGYGSGDSKKEAEQQAAFSVSQGFKEEDCAKLLDKLDAIEKGFPRPASKPSQAAGPHPDDSAAPDTAEPAKASGRNRSRRDRKRTAAENNTAAANAAANGPEHDSGTADNVAEDNAQETKAAEQAAAPASEKDATSAQESAEETAGPAATDAAGDSGKPHTAAEHTVPTHEETAEAAPAAETVETADGEGKNRPPRRPRRKGARAATAPNQQDDNASPAAQAQALPPAEMPATSVMERQTTQSAATAADEDRSVGTMPTDENTAGDITGSDTATDTAPGRRTSRSAAKRRTAKQAGENSDTPADAHSEGNTVAAEATAQEAAPKPKAKRRSPARRTAKPVQPAADSPDATAASEAIIPDAAARPAGGTEDTAPTPAAEDMPHTGGDSHTARQQ